MSRPLFADVPSSDSSSNVNSSTTTTSIQPQPPTRDSNGRVKKYPGSHSGSDLVISAGSGARSTSDEETPAARRQRLDPDFVDLDFD